MNTLYKILWGGIWLLLLAACESTPTYVARSSKSSKKIKTVNPLIEINRKLRKQEDKAIENYIERKRWKMKVNGEGLRYWIYQKNENGQIIENGDEVSFAYTMCLLNGDTIYTSSKKGLKTLLIGKRREIKGLEEGILLMKKNEKAKFIIPSHLAYGVSPEDPEIPVRATLVYDIQIVDIKSNK